MFELPPPSADGLHTPKVGPQSADKHHFLQRYIDAFTTAMKAKPWRGGLHYIDLFASAGIEDVEGIGLRWGSPLIAAQAPNRFAQLHFCELKKRPFEALRTRLAQFPQPKPPQLILGDANKVVAEIVSALPPQSLSLAFLDPYGLHLDFSTVQALSRKRVDLIIFFPDRLDALRNWEHVYKGDPDSNLDRVLGTKWLEEMHSAPKNRWAQVLGDIYIRQIKTLNYSEIDSERISLPNGRFLYKLIFCSRDKAEIKLWRGISRRRPGGQGMLNF